MTAKVTVSVRLAVTPAVAFDLFTGKIDAWWRRGPKYRIHADRGGRLRFEPGEGGRLIDVYDGAAGDLYEIGKILVWRPGERLVFEWRLPSFTAGQVTEVDVAFVPVGEGTRIVLEHRGWETVPKDHPARHGLDGGRFLLIRARWWEEQLDALGTSVASSLR